MLQKLNERIQGVVAWIVIILVAVTFTLFGVDYYLQSRHDSDVQVDVNDQPITKQAFELNYRRTRQMRDPSLMTAALENQLKQQVLDEMIVNTVSMQAARSNGFEVDASQANAAILSIPQFQQDGHFSPDRYQQALNGAFFTPESFQKEVRQGMLLNQQRFAFMGTSFALPSEIKQFVKLYMQTRDYDYMQIPVLRFIKQAAVSPQEIEAYYKQHQKEFLSPEKVSIDYIRLSMADIKGNIKISEQQIERYYEENQGNYYTPAQWKVAHILFAVPADVSDEERQQIKKRAEDAYHALEKNPAQFEQQVKAVSDDKISALNGGILPWIVAGQSAGLDKALVNLTKPGQIIPPVKSPHGYELFKLIAYKPALVKPLAEVKGAIHDQLLADLGQAQYAQLLEQLSDISYQAPDSLAPVAKTLKLVVKTSAPFSRQGGDNEITQNKQVINAAFSHDVLVLGNNSEPVQLDNESVIVLRVNKHLPATEKTLAEVSAVIAEKLALNKAKIVARQLGKELLNAHQKVVEQDKLINQNNLKWHTVTEASRESEPASQAINDMAFSIARVGAEIGRSLVTGDYVIVHLKKINDGQINKLDKEQVASIAQQIEANYGMMDYDLYVSHLMSKAKIKKHN
jgi:peptidyl-prolyl cis-trans isomerase D